MSKLGVRLIFLVATILLLAGWNNGFCAEQEKWLGFIVDKQCADSIRGSTEAESFVQAHTKDCALMCKDKGFAFYSHGKWFGFDAKGSGLALKVLQESKRPRGFYVEVIGKAQNQILLVETIKEVQQPRSNKHHGVNHNGTY
jgi:hypothetical protein